ncbi:MAG: hypothetical protein CO120_05020, partial [Gammaproteobacteria bacterium CG_4_9_14_3_um_filter_38_9]
MKALIYGENDALLFSIPALLTRAGFEVDVISTVSSLRKHRYIKNFIAVDSPEALIEMARQYVHFSYDFVACCDEALLLRILSASFTLAEKILLLPVVNDRYFSHLGTKIGLSELLKKSGISTPDFLIAQNQKEMMHCARTLKFPVFVKMDASSGGAGVFECYAEADLAALTHVRYPVLVQKKIEGTLISSGGLFLNKKLIFFEIAEALLYRSYSLGPSVIKKYRRPTEKDLPVFEKVCALGEALGADGFVNLTWIESDHDATLFFIEADMRPNVWVEYAKYFLEDPAEKIKRYFKSGASLTKNTFIETAGPELILAYAPRLSYRDILFNRYNWRSHYAN